MLLRVSNVILLTRNRVMGGVSWLDFIESIMATTITKPSAQSLLIQMQFQGQPLSTGTGFLVDTPKGMALITNRHNVTGKHQETGQPLSKTAGIPDELLIIHNKQGRLGEWVGRLEKLLDSNGKPLWFEHLTLRPKADFVALLLTEKDDISTFPYDLNNTGPDMLVGPADIVSVIGFPFGIQVGGSLAVWATGFVASEPDIDFNGLPVFLIDCRSRQGQSGSAVIAYRGGGAIARKDGRTTSFPGTVTKFLGVYSGRINSESDLGIVWKASAIKEMVDAI